MSQKKQTARKTTGKHFAFGERRFFEHVAAALNSPVPSPRRKIQSRRGRGGRPTGTPSSRRKSPPPPLKSILKRPSSAASSSTAGSTSLPSITRLPSSSDDDVPLVSSPRKAAPGPVPVPVPVPPPPPVQKPGPLTPWHRQLFEVLDPAISVCARFATWLENQSCVDSETLLRALERDGSHFLSLAKASVQFDCALRGVVPPAEHDVPAPGSLADYVRTLRVFADLLSSKLAEGSLTRELENGVLRHGEPLLRLALGCLEFDRAIRGSKSS